MTFVEALGYRNAPCLYYPPQCYLQTLCTTSHFRWMKFASHHQWGFQKKLKILAFEYICGQEEEDPYVRTCAGLLACCSAIARMIGSFRTEILWLKYTSAPGAGEVRGEYAVIWMPLFLQYSRSCFCCQQGCISTCSTTTMPTPKDVD